MESKNDSSSGIRYTTNIKIKEIMIMKVGEKSTIDTISFGARAKQLEQEAKAEQDKIQKAKNSPFRNFVQMNVDSIKYLVSINRLNPNALNILLFLIENMDYYNSLVCPQSVLMEYFGLSRSTVSRCISELKKHGFIHIKRENGASRYYISDKLVWKSWGTNIEQCEFPSNVMLTMSEKFKRDIKKDRNVKKARTSVLKLKA